MPANIVYSPKVSMFGAGCISELPGVATSFGIKKALIVTDKVLSSIGMVERIQGILAEGDVKSVVFDDTHPNPTDINVMDCAELFKKEKCDAIISLGGGSAHDLAKAAVVIAENGGKVRDYNVMLGVQFTQSTPIICINTTAGTGSDGGKASMITDTETHLKVCISNPCILPVAAFNDPELMLSKPPALTAATGMDVMTHAVECYLSRKAFPFTDALSASAIEITAKYLPQAVGFGNNIVARDMMANAQYMAGVAFASASLGMVHALAHQLGGQYDLPHGVCNAILLPYVMEFNVPTSAERLKQVAILMGENVGGLSTNEAAKSTARALKKMGLDLGMPESLKELGTVDPKDFEMMAANSFKDATSLFSPRPMTLSQAVEIFEKAYEGAPLGTCSKAKTLVAV